MPSDCFVACGLLAKTFLGETGAPEGTPLRQNASKAFFTRHCAPFSRVRLCEAAAAAAAIRPSSAMSQDCFVACGRMKRDRLPRFARNDVFGKAGQIAALRSR